MITPCFSPASAARLPRAAILLSGAGSNADALLRYCAETSGVPFRPVVVATDAPRNSAAAEIAARFGLPPVGCDLRAFYAEHGESSIRLDTPRRRELRDLWTARLWELLRPFEPDFVLLAGFVPLTNLNRRLPCLNVHPGDLTVEDSDGHRLFAGLHYLPVERAILHPFPSLRSSVILTQPFTGAADDIDAGPVLGVSTPLPIDLEGESLETLRGIAARRGAPPHRDRLREIAAHNIERLKTAGDHVVFPRAAADFAAGRFGVDEAGALYYRGQSSAEWQRVRTVEYSASAAPRPIPE